MSAPIRLGKDAPVPQTADAANMIREWAAKTRPTLSDPPEGQEWRVYLHPFTEDDLDPETGELKMRYEWVLVDVASAS